MRLFKKIKKRKLLEERNIEKERLEGRFKDIKALANQLTNPPAMSEFEYFYSLYNNFQIHELVLALAYLYVTALKHDNRYIDEEDEDEKYKSLWTHNAT